MNSTWRSLIMKIVRLVPVALLALTVLAATAALAAPAAEKPWFDMENCSFCKQMNQPGLMDHFKMEYHDVDNGLVSVAYIDADYWDEFDKAMEGMMAVVKEMESGKVLPMCGHCEKMGELQMKGVKMERVKSEKCIIHIYSTQDAEVLKEVHAFGDRCAQENEKRAAAEKG
jgi:hypothetical protein